MLRILAALALTLLAPWASAAESWTPCRNEHLCRRMTGEGIEGSPFE